MANNTILILSNSDAGLYEFRKEVVRALIEQGDRVYISVPDTGYIEKLAELGATMLVTALDRRGMNPKKDLALYKEYKKLLKQIKPDSVLTYTIKPNVYGGVACRKAKIPYLANVTGLGSTLQGNGPVKQVIVRMYRSGLKGAACIFFQNEFNLEFMKKERCIKQNAHTRLLAGSGVNLEEHKLQDFPPDNTIHLVSVGRIMDDKGSAELLKVAEAIHQKYPHVVFDILGSFEEETRDKYEQWVLRLRDEGAVVFHGFRDDVDKFYGDCQAIVHPSYHEGMSNVVQEAAAAGRAVITSDIPGCKEIYENGIGGIAFAPRSTESLMEAIEAFVNMPYEARKKMGYAARKYVEKKFDRKIVVDAYLEEINLAQNAHI